MKDAAQNPARFRRKKRRSKKPQLPALKRSNRMNWTKCPSRKALIQFVAIRCGMVPNWLVGGTGFEPVTSTV
jgi:hypothetical protein